MDFSPAQTDEIVRLYCEELMSGTAIGHRFGVSRIPIYTILRRHNIPIRPPGNVPSRMSAQHVYRRFWEKVKKFENGCWEWQGCVDSGGYGCFLAGDGKTTGAHRYSWLLSGKSLPRNLPLSHRCGNHKCVNPDHLELTGLTHLHKLTDQQVREIRALCDRGATKNEVCAQYGIGRSQFYRIKHGQSRKNA